MDGKPTNFSEDDIARRNTISNLLAEWNLYKIINPEKTKSPVAPISQIKIIAYKEKSDWILEQKYNIGKKRSS